MTTLLPFNKYNIPFDVWNRIGWFSLDNIACLMYKNVQLQFSFPRNILPGKNFSPFEKKVLHIFVLTKRKNISPQILSPQTFVPSILFVPNTFSQSICPQNFLHKKLLPRNSFPLKFVPTNIFSQNYFAQTFSHSEMTSTWIAQINFFFNVSNKIHIFVTMSSSCNSLVVLILIPRTCIISTFIVRGLCWAP